VSVGRALATAGVAFAIGMYGLWSHPLGWPAMTYGAGLMALALVGFLAGRGRSVGTALASGVGAFVGVASAWFLTVAVDPRDPGDGFLVVWLVAGACAGLGHLAGTIVFRAHPVRQTS